MSESCISILIQARFLTHTDGCPTQYPFVSRQCEVKAHSVSAYFGGPRLLIVCNTPDSR